MSDVPQLNELEYALRASYGSFSLLLQPSISTVSPVDLKVEIGSTPMKEYRDVLRVPSTDSRRNVSPRELLAHGVEYGDWIQLWSSRYGNAGHQVRRSTVRSGGAAIRSCTGMFVHHRIIESIDVLYIVYWTKISNTLLGAVMRALVL